MTRGVNGVKTIALSRMTIQNFKGCRYLKLDFGGKSGAIFGDNATGKTTVYDSVSWLLFGKDSKGRGSFEIKPLNANGEVADHAAITSVEAILSVDGDPIKLKKTFYEQWTTKRGHAEATYDGNTSEFYVDDVPLKKGEYERRIAEIVDEEKFRALTNVAWFCEQLDWRKRRDMLFTVCEMPDDKTIMARDQRFHTLMKDMGSLNIDDYKRKLLSQRKGVSAERNTIPARIDEQHKLVQDLSTVDFIGLNRKRSALAEQMETLQGDLLKLNNDTLISSKRNELAALSNDLRALNLENDAFRKSQTPASRDKTSDLCAAISDATISLEKAKTMERADSDLAAGLEKNIDRCRKAWDAENKMTFTNDTCVTCGQKLPEKALKVAQAAFAAERERNKQRAVDESAAYKLSLKAAQERISRWQKDAVECEAKIKRLEAELSAYVPDVPPVVSDMPSFAAKSAELNEKISGLNNEIAELQSESSEKRFAIESSISGLKTQIQALDSELAKESLLSFARKREEELRAEARNNAEILSALDKQLFLCEEFARFKVEYTEQSINGRFSITRWKLFAEQVNGGLADCCEATFDGVPYGSLNSGMRINVGIDVINTLSAHYGISVPLFVDNAESVTALRNAGTQVIRLVVSESDKELRVEHEN